MTRQWGSALAVLSCAALLGACGVHVTYPALTSAPPSTTRPTAPSAAPTVTKPKQLMALLDNPCGLLTTEQRTGLGVSTDGKPGGNAEAGTAACTWSNFDQRPGMAASITARLETRRSGLDQVYRRSVEFKAFEPITVDSYPAVRVQNDEFRCHLWIGAAEDQSIELSFSSVLGTDPKHSPPCGFAEKVAAAMLANIPGAR
ncbi:DUF3558 domain-containing protein [Crossiella sp. NPDC003009]